MPSIHIFDAYGTLFDVHSAVRAHQSALGPKADALSALWRAKQLEYSWVYGLMDAPNDFWTITQDALDFAMNVYGVQNDALQKALLDAYWALLPYEEVIAYLEKLRASGCKTGILSNGSHDMLNAAVSSAGLSPLLDGVLSVQDANTFKTHRNAYELVTQHFETSPQEVTFYSSNRWDIAGATHFGFQTIWVNRTHQPDEYKGHKPQNVVDALK